MDSTTTVAPETCFDTLPKLEGYENVAISCNQKSGGGINWEWASQADKDRCDKANILLTVSDLVKCQMRNQDSQHTWTQHERYSCAMAVSYIKVVAPHRVEELDYQLERLPSNDSQRGELEYQKSVVECAITLFKQEGPPSWLSSWQPSFMSVNDTALELGRDNASTASPESNWIIFNVPNWVLPFVGGIAVGYIGALISWSSGIVVGMAVNWIMNRYETQEEAGGVVENIHYNGHDDYQPVALDNEEQSLSLPSETIRTQRCNGIMGWLENVHRTVSN